MGLNDYIQNEQVKAAMISECVTLIDEQVAAKKGLTGIALKAAYGVVKGIGASYIPGAIGRLLPEVLLALDPLWVEGGKTHQPADYLIQNASQTADRILSITDAKIEKTSNGMLRSTYNKLRPSVKKDVEEAVPGLVQIIDRQVQAAG